jgi:hypothetical protein
MKVWTNLLILFCGLVWLLWGAGQTVVSQPQANSPHLIYLPGISLNIARPALANPISYGVNFISSAEGLADEQQYQNGLATNATWNRWPFYWPLIEPMPGVFDWSNQDATVQADIAHGLQINAILLGTPVSYTTNLAAGDEVRPSPPSGLSLQAVQAATPIGLYEPVFDDGTDVLGPGKAINEANVWARFVWLIVNRYKPGGQMAQQQQWPAGVGITHWEMWNEPDLPFFWDSSLADYARLLKVGYLAAKHADPQARVLSGAMANYSLHLSYYDEILAIYDNDPLAAQHHYFHDIFATHSYFHAWNSWFHIWRATNMMAAHGIPEKAIWFNESGVVAWDDYPGPVWDPQSPLRATVSEQAAYTIQSAFYAAFAGADAIFHFQLYDGCGNQPQGTDFPPHNGELCDANGHLIGQPGIPCAGDAHGLYTNPADAACFRQHPQPESPRPQLAAYQVVTEYLVDVAPFWRLRPGSNDPANGPQEWIAFYRPATKERIIGMWARFGQDETAVLEATSPDQSALLIYPDGHTLTITAVNNHYTILLPAATNQNAPWDPNLYPIGGQPVIVVEKMP